MVWRVKGLDHRQSIRSNMLIDQLDSTQDQIAKICLRMEVAGLETALAVLVQVPKTVEDTEVGEVLFQVLAFDLARVDLFEELEE